MGGTELNVRNPFTDPPGAPSFSDPPVDTLSAVELAAYESPTTGDIAVGLTVHKEDATTEELLAQIPSDALAIDRVDCGVQTITVTPLGEEQHPRDSAEVNGDKLGESSGPTP